MGGEKRAMYKSFLIFIFITPILFVAGCEDNTNNSLSSVSPGQTSLYVANMSTLSVINLESGMVENDVFGLGNAPNDIVSVGNRLIVVNSLSNDLNFFHVVTENRLLQDGVVALNLYDNPWAATSDGRGHLLITNMMQNSVSVLSLESREIERRLPAGIAPEPVIVCGDYAYVGNTAFDFSDYTYHAGSIWKYDLRTWEIVDSLAVGTNPQDIAVDPLGRLHAVCTGNYVDITGQIYVVEPATFSVVMVIDIGGAPNRIAVAPDSTAYLSAGGWGMLGAPHGVVFRYRCDNGEILRGWEDPIQVGLGANDVGTTQTGRVFVCCFDENRIDELRADTVCASFIVGTGPCAILAKE
jgi:DNA-binding beta-propeller fold protein YncE